MGTQWSRSESDSSLLLVPEVGTGWQTGDDDDDSLDGLDRQEDIARFPYVEFTGRDSITCPTCQGTGHIPSEQVNELVALVPYNDQRLRPQRTKLYVVLSAVLCLLASSLVVFFLFPRSVVVEDDGIRSVTVQFDHTNTKVLMNMTVNFTVSVQISGSTAYVYAFCTMASIKVHNILVIMQTSVKTSYMMRTAQNTLEAYRYIDCGSNSTVHQPPRRLWQ
ncbi:transmembrane protein 106C isoform X2 [Salvelinus sp. IW2-2015]|uniref:transmembrane protein 106C isoform X2 n=1 Tax=Salvelinus sp. IW2-2015 TaxID=2691554 RepID=UPI0038D37339